jgi:hypothetical protein
VPSLITVGNASRLFAADMNNIAGSFNSVNIRFADDMGNFIAPVSCPLFDAFDYVVDYEFQLL